MPAFFNKNKMKKFIINTILTVILGLIITLVVHMSHIRDIKAFDTNMYYYVSIALIIFNVVDYKVDSYFENKEQ